MPVEVNIPVGVDLIGDPRPEDLTQVEIATGDAVRGALEVILDKVIMPRGRARKVVVQRGETYFSTSVKEHVRDPVQIAIDRALRYAIASSEIEKWHDPTRVAALSGERVAEPFRSERYKNGYYRVPSYDDKGTPKPASVEEEGEIFEYTGPPLTLDEALVAAWDAHKKRFGGIWDPTSLGYPGYYGSFDIDGTWCDDQLVYISHISALDEQHNPIEWWWQGASFSLLSVPDSATDEEDPDKIDFSRTPLPTSMDHYVLTKTADAATLDNLVRVQKEAAKNDPTFPHTPDIRKAMAESVADPSLTIFRLEGGPHQFHIVLHAGDDKSGIGHSPIRFIVQSQMEIGASTGKGAGAAKDQGRGRKSQGGKEGEGGKNKTGTGKEGGGKGKGGPRGGPLGKTEGEGSLWPVLGLGGDKLVCEPFLGEPPVDQLVTGGTELEDKMRDLAAQLELEYCGYAGQFCVNLAKLIGARAHAIGVTSANSETTTNVTVRTDGAGNNGFVDVQPGDAPELTYLQLLGSLAADVDYLSGRITTIYGLPANRHLIYWDEDRELDPDPAAWSLRFLYAMYEELERSCMWLFAEGCRVILLQQLRSSNQGITGRQGRFDDTLTAFKDALGILGESVVKLSTLKRAIEWADRYNLTGSVRSVLSHEPPAHRFRDDYYQPPAPIESVSPKIMELIESATVEEQGDTHVVNYQGRNWTAEDLQGGVAMRRGMLNRVDPLFLQVPDLDSLYTQYRAHDEYAKTYLTNLLDEMLKANIEMTKQSSAEEKGAFFALEASQYIKAKGGMNSLGLRYDLQGIHQLADNVLRPYAGGTSFYSLGINRAIDIKANFDDFLSIFATFGIIALALLCAPLGAVAVGFVTGVAGLALTIHDIHEADRLESLYKSLEDPEAILSWQEVQLARLMANISIAFSIFDVIGVAKGAKAIVSGVEYELKVAMRAGLKGAAIVAARNARRTILENMAEEVLRNAVKQAMTELAIVGAMHLLMPKVITPVLVPWMRGIGAAHGTLPEVDAALGPLAVGQPAAPTPITDVQVGDDMTESAEGTLPDVDTTDDSADVGPNDLEPAP